MGSSIANLSQTDITGADSIPFNSVANGANRRTSANQLIELMLQSVPQPSYSSQGLSGVEYAGPNPTDPCIGYTFGDITYTLTGWGTSEVLISGSDGSTSTITLDGSGRITGVT